MARLRHIARLMVPWWLFVDDGQKVVEAFALLADAYRQRLRDGLDARFPSRAGDSAATLISKYRLIPRGRDEVLSHFAQRLIAWRGRNGHRTRGNAYALLAQVYHYWGGIACWGIDRNGNRRARAADGTESFEYGYAWDWDGGAASSWSRQWVVLDATGSALAAQDDFGDTIGIAGSTAQDWVAMRRLVDAEDPHRWLASGTQPEWMIVSFDGTAPAPDGTWGRWGVLDGTDLVPARDSDFRYVALRDDLRLYAGDPEIFPNAFVTPYFGTIAGDPTSFPLTISMPDGSTYAGNSAIFPATIRMPDDGDTPA